MPVFLVFTTNSAAEYARIFFNTQQGALFSLSPCCVLASEAFFVEKVLEKDGERVKVCFMHH